MPDTNFSIELQGLSLPDDVKNRLQSELRTTVLSELAKTDLGSQMSVEPLAQQQQRSLLPLPPVWGFIIRNLGGATGPLTARDAGQPAANGALATLVSGAPTLPLGGASLADLLPAVYYRPDIRAAIASNSKAFAALLSHDDQATQAFNELTGGVAAPGDGSERLVPLAIGAILLGCAAAGAIVGYLSRK